MKNKLLIFIILFILVVAGGSFIAANKLRDTSLINPSATSSPTPALISNQTPSPSPTVETFHFDKSTNLKQTLQSVDPKVEDKNIEDLKNIIKSF